MRGGSGDNRRRTLWAPALSVLLAVAAAGAGFARDGSFELDLGGLRFDPLTAFPDLPSRGRHAEQPGPDFRLVQFEGPIRGEWLEAVRARGVHLVQYIHPYTYVVWADRARLDGLRGADGVRWTGELAVEFRVLPAQRGRAAAVVPTAALVSRQVEEAALRHDLELAGARVHDLTPVTSQLAVVYLDVPGDRYLDLGAIPAVYTVQYIPPEAGPRGEMSNQSVVGNHGPPPDHTLFPGYVDWLADTGYDGSGVIVGIVDGGIRTTHDDLEDRIVPCVPSGDSPTSCTTFNHGHGTHVAGAVAGTGASGILDPAGFLRGQGVAPGASLVQQRYDPFIGGGPGNMQPNGMLKIYRESALSGALLTNNSWGPTGTPQGYDIPTQQVDIITRDADPNIEGHQQVLPVWSIMNGGGDGGGGPCAPSSLGSPDEAKNLFAVGSTKMQPGVGQQHPDIFDVSNNSAHGPACDGRLVPHVVAPGCNTDSASSSSDAAHGLLCGTSMASPVVSGSVSIFIERYRDLHGADPSPALVKAALTAVAKDLNGFQNADGGTMGHPPDRFQGWGRIDLDAVANPPDNAMFFDQEVVLTESGESWTVPVVAEDPSKPVRLMLVWTDVPGHGLGGTTPAWVNDLDLTVEAASGLYLGNQIGPDGYSQTGGDADGKNNTEGAFLRPDQHGGGTVVVTVVAANLAGDALDPYDPDSPNLAQDFALACYNCDFSAPLPVLQLDPASLDFGDVTVGTTSPPQIATLHNDGSALATGLAFGGLPDGGFEADTSDCGTSLAPGASCEVSVTFTPEDVGAATATLEADSAEGSAASLAVEGEGVSASVVATPVELEVDPDSGTSDGNGVFEPAELVTVAPAWRNDGASATELTGGAAEFDGPAGAVYSLVNGTAAYGLVAPGATASCLDTGDCYQMGLNDPVTHPAAHWDAIFEETLAGGPTRIWTLHIGDSFTDVPRASSFYPWIETLLHHGVTGGCAPTTYCPSAANTRDQMPVFLLKALEGSGYAPPACTGVFDDVPCPSLFADWIEDLVSRGITAGCGGGNYCPNNTVTRDQMAVFLLKTLEGPGYAPPACTGVFGDVPCPSLFAAWIEDLVARGITAGCGSGAYCPSNPVSRDQMAVFLAKTFGLTLYGP